MKTSASRKQKAVGLILTVLIIIFGETIPKITAKKNANRISLRNAVPIRGLMFVLKL